MRDGPRRTPAILSLSRGCTGRVAPRPGGVGAALRQHPALGIDGEAHPHRAVAEGHPKAPGILALFAEGGTGVITVDIAYPPDCSADIDGSGTIDFGDLNALLDQWGTPGPEADIDGSGTVDFNDLNILLDGWAVTCT